MKTLFWLCLLQLPSSTPVYREDSVVNAASQTGNRFSPNSILTLYGTNLTFGTLNNPNISGSGVRMVLGGEFLDILFISPTQVNFLIPAATRPANYLIQLVRESVGAPRIPIVLREQSPELFATPENWLLATRSDGSFITGDKPARPGETIVFYGTGFGPVVTANRTATVNWLEFASEFRVLLNGEETPGIYYVGITPTYRGLYQVNFTLPEGKLAEANPEIRVAARGDKSRPATRLWFNP